MWSHVKTSCIRDQFRILRWNRSGRAERTVTCGRNIGSSNTVVHFMMHFAISITGLSIQALPASVWACPKHKQGKGQNPANPSSTVVENWFHIFPVLHIRDKKFQIVTFQVKDMVLSSQWMDSSMIVSSIAAQPLNCEFQSVISSLALASGNYSLARWKTPYLLNRSVDR